MRALFYLLFERTTTRTVAQMLRKQWQWDSEKKVHCEEPIIITLRVTNYLDVCSSRLLLLRGGIYNHNDDFIFISTLFFRYV